MDFNKAVLESLKERYVRFIGKFEYDDKMSSPQAIYYFKNLDDNLIEPMTKETVNMYSQGDGNELESKMKALKSSSAMTYNLIGNGNIRVKLNAEFEPGEYSVTFEKQLSTIKNNPKKANLDAFLESKKELIFCEIKMTEWLFNRPGILRKPYLNKENYNCENSYQAFNKCINEVSVLKPTDNGDVKCRFKYYDAFQMLKHSIAIYNYARKESKTIPKKITLVNCVWHLPDSESLPESNMRKYKEAVKLEKEEFDIFYRATDEIRGIFKKIGIEFDIKYMDAKKFVESFEKTPAQLNYLMRYSDLSD